MNSLLIAGVVFGSAFGGALLGIYLQKMLPEAHLKHESRDAIRLASGLVATMAALVLGLLVGSAKQSFDAQTSGFQQLATNIMLLDRALAHYGPEAAPSRESLKLLVGSTIDLLWPADGSPHATLVDDRISKDGNAFFDSVRELDPKTEAQRAAQDMAMQTAAEIGRTRWQLSQQSEATLPPPFLVVLVFWLFVLFLSFGLFAPRNPTVTVAFLVAALSVAGAVLLIVDLDQPFEGLLQVSSSPLTSAYAHLGK